jgi:predicted HTH transcriptional regulator
LNLESPEIYNNFRLVIARKYLQFSAEYATNDRLLFAEQLPCLKKNERSMTGVPEFRFLTNHALVLRHIAHKPRITARELSTIVNITERTTLRIINDLMEANYIKKVHEGRRNRYSINPDMPISAAGLEDVAAEVLLKAFGWKRRGRPRKAAGSG